ncbi:hypothetical protein RIR_jg165.t1 [Rhizophagus irregularis DAOM 181602=DAOM 197198]|nr:hypothetical protein RIR_jg165.t1 [Rhizophagus irregularis DAOM 181602=DAOM 197198]
MLNHGINTKNISTEWQIRNEVLENDQKNEIDNVIVGNDIKLDSRKGYGYNFESYNIYVNQHKLSNKHISINFFCKVGTVRKDSEVNGISQNPNIKDYIMVLQDKYHIVKIVVKNMCIKNGVNHVK